MLGAPGSEHACAHTGTDKQARGSVGPHLPAEPKQRRSPAARARRRSGLWSSEGDRRAPHTRANPAVLVAWAKEHGKPAAAVHGGATARVVASEASPALARREEVLRRLSDAVRCSCTRKRGGRGSGAGLSARSQAPVRDSWPVKAYHGEPTRARGARGGGRAAGETELALVTWSGRNG